MNYKFSSYDEYLEWCSEIISRIYYANIGMNNEAIKKCVSEIDSKLHVTEGNSLIKCDPEN